MAAARKFKVSINPGLIDKNASGDLRLFTEGFENVELTMGELADHVTQGHAHSVQLSGPRRGTNFLASDVACVDVDRGLTLEDALAEPLVRDHAAMIYTTVSHRPDAHRFRVVYALPRTITCPKEMRAVQRSLATRLLGDRAAVDPARIFYGNRQAQTWILNHEISPDLLADLIAQSINPGTTDNGRDAPTRVAADLRPEQIIRLADGRTLPFSQLPRRATIFCPYHADQRASAFSVSNRHGVTGIYCSSCAITYWPRGPADEWDFGSFDKAARAALALFRQNSDPGPLGPFFNPPEARRALTHCHVVVTDGSAAPPELTPGLTLVKAPKGSGKTQAVKGLITDAKSVLLIGHRRSLLRNSCARLGLHCYLDDGPIRNGGFSRYGICLDSILKVDALQMYDVVVLDESEQLLAHVLAETMERRDGGGRDRIFQNFWLLVGGAKRVVALDADLGWLSFQILRRMRPHAASKGDSARDNNSSTRVWINQSKPGAGKVIEVFRSKSHLVAELKNEVAAGSRCFVTANSKELVAKLDAMLRKAHPEKKILLVTADTSSLAPQQAFLSAPAVEARTYDVVLTSPAVGTGVDISFPGDEAVFDSVFGFCEPLVNTHFDFDQQIGRVRHPKAVKVYVTKRRFHFETNEEAIKRDILEKSLFKNTLQGYRDDGTAEYLESDPLIELATLVLAEQRASKNALLPNFVNHKQSQGYEIRFVHLDHNAGEQGRAALAAGAQLDEAEFRTRVLAATTLRWHAFDCIRHALKSGGVVAETDRFDYEHTRIELFYREGVTEELLGVDRRGRYRAGLRLLPTVLWILEKGISEAAFDQRARLIRDEKQKFRIIASALACTPFYRKGELDPTVVFDRSGLDEFQKYVAENGKVIETQLGLEIRADVGSNPVQQLTGMLKLIGLKLTRAGTIKRDGAKIYRYRLDPEVFAQARRIIRRRQTSDGWEYIYEMRGWKPDWPERQY